MLDQRPARWKLPLYFVIQLALLTASVYLLDTVNGIWLVAVPLVGTTVGRLPFWGQIAVSSYILVMLAWQPVGKPAFH